MNKKSTLRSAANYYLTHPKANNGITLIALVVTIIVLLILAGVSIAMLSGNNGILQRATDARYDTERQQIIETAKVEIMGTQTENKSSKITKEQLTEILNKQFNTTDPTTLPDEITNESNINLTTKDDKYTVKLSEIYLGEFAKKARINLKPGDYVSYNGETRVVALDENDKFYLLSDIVENGTLDTYSDIIDSSEYLDWDSFKKIAQQFDFDVTKVNDNYYEIGGDNEGIMTPLSYSGDYYLNTLWRDTADFGTQWTGYESNYIYVGFGNRVSGRYVQVWPTTGGNENYRRYFSQLKDNLRVSSGEGSKANPFILALN